jgi:D-alanyl-D-alanine carboxypeptidase/D-alanyl-D-alanine-endopeptidase (penicillin-binding protein 4)
LDSGARLVNRHLCLLIAAAAAAFLAIGWSPAARAGLGAGHLAGSTETSPAAGSATLVAAAQNTRRGGAGRSQAERALEAAAKLPWPESVVKLAGGGAVLVADPHAGPEGPAELFALNPDQGYVPASILKLVTAAAALEILGPEYRFATDFYLTREGDLWLVGRGDPFLVSEELCLIADELVRRGLQRVRGVHLDTGFFEPGLVLDGTSFTTNPYDAFNAALGVNFNTVNYLIDRQGRIVEFDECTPLTPIALELAEANRPRRPPRQIRQFRVNIAEAPAKAEEQAGQFFKALLERRGVEVAGDVAAGGRLPAGARPLYSHSSTRALSEHLATLLEYSNNFMTNQIFLTMGAERYGPPATMEKGRQAVLEYLDSKGLPRLELVEGSGLSRLNSLTARQMAGILAAFEPYMGLVKASGDGSVRFKTGTMSDISTLAGYLIRPDRPEEPLSFVILLNGAYPPGTREKILEVLKARFIGGPAAAAGG